MGNFNLYVICVICVGYVTGGISKIGPPIIEITESEYIIKSQSNFNLTCLGRKPIIWTYPNETIEGEFFSKIEVQTAELRDTPYPYHANLIIKNASFVDTGYFYCHEIEAEKDAEGKSSKIYIYVRDEEHLSTLTNDVQFMSVPQNSDAIIPCRPTSPDVHVKLFDFNGEQVNYKHYDPKVGFTIFVASLLNSGNYLCEFTYNDIEEEILVHLKVISTPTSVERPSIDVANNGKTSVGQTIVLNCTIKVDSNVYFEMTWDVPDKKGVESGRINYTKAYIDRNRHELGWSALTIHNVTLKDAGNYSCKVEDHVHNKNDASKEIIVLNKNESHINLSVVIDDITVTAGKNNVTWVVNIDAYPEVKIVWLNNKGEKILPDTDMLMVPKYKVTKTTTKTTLVILNLTLNDSGTYQLEAMNGIEKKVLNLTLSVQDKPSVTIVSNKYQSLNGDGILHCVATGYPLPEVRWFLRRCETNNCSYLYINPDQYSIIHNKTQTTATINIKAVFSGSVKCFANNTLGNDTAIKDFLITDVDNGFNVWGLVDSSAVATGENVKLNCGASIYGFSDTIKWYIWKNNTRQPIPQDKRFRIKKNRTDYSYQISLSIDSIQLNDSGKYVCVTRGIQPDDKKNYYFNQTIIVKEPVRPTIIETNLDGTEMQIKAGAPVTLNCTAEGIPAPEIIWKKNGDNWSILPNNSHITLSKNNTILSFKYLVDDDSGEYSCNAVNKFGSDSQKIRLLLKNSNWGKFLVITLVVLAIIFVLLCTVLIVKIRKEKKLRHELKIAGLQHFEKGALESLNPDLGVDDQAELLPYDKKWEFPRDKLKLGKQLGSGAFGVVMKADAIGLCEGETVTTVAVKMVKRNADYTYIKALASELKIMVHLGKHLNVVNLLGACTKNVAKRELLVIVEYCRYGNLHNYLLRHRDDFINQIDPKTGTIDASIGAEYLNRTMSVGSNQSGSRSPTFAGVDYRATPLTNSCNTDSTVVCSPSGEDTMILSNNSAQPEWRSNYRGDYNKGNVKPISTHDLLCWAFQVARGMEYLASRKVLHGDLAARNILLAEENIVKICDFGLAKSMYKSDNYKKKGDGPLPVKWMAVESIRDRVFSTQSDVWSYGIVLWEFFSLAKTPYPGMDADERLYNKLIEGYRMDKPEYATKDIYQIILECWDAKPVYRPSFNKLAESLGSMLQESVRQHYISLNDPYIIMNNTQMEGQSDYLAMLSPPDYGNLASPSCHEYVNGLQIPQDPAAEASTSGYLPMDIFSPKPGANIFDFESEAQKKQKNRDEVGSGTELLPILHSTVDSDSELPSPTSPTKNFVNPGYNVLPTIEDNNKLIEPKKDILPTSDNYINMPQQKKALGITDAFSNPNYVDINKKNLELTSNENNYVNSQSRDWERL